jgi:tricorn protease
MSGIDWKACYTRYAPLVDRVGSRSEYSDLVWEMIGELGTSHCYEIGGDYRPEPHYGVGHLAAEYRWSGKGWRIDRIIHGDPWDEEAGSPLVAPGVNVKAGDVIVAIDGKAATKSTPPGALLLNRAGAEVALTLADKRTVWVKALRDEQPVRYRDWVEHNRRWVHEKTKGRVGYVHVPDMGPHGYAEFHRSYLSEVDRDALVIDVRHNGGGHVSMLLLEKLARKRLGYDIQRWGVPSPYPGDSPAGPLVAITDETAGSDGDIFSHCWKLMKLGPLVGKRTWGGVVGIWPRHFLVDGSITTQPEFSFWFKDVGFGVENYGTDPDIVVDLLPQDVAAGRDPQLERSVEVALDLLKKHTPLTPPRVP